MGTTAEDREDFTFELTEELIDEIIFCMEDQNTEYVMNRATGEIFPRETASLSGKDMKQMIDLPEWRSSDGFIMMEKFISSLHNPLYKEELRNVMSVGKGVFRNFKSTVKKYEPLKKRWYNFKDRYMKDLVIEWYTVSREAWHFTRLGSESIETENLVLSDFTFSTDCEWSDREILDAEESLVQEAYGKDSLLGRYHLESIRRWRSDPETPLLSVCSRALDGTFAGIMWGVFWCPGEEESALLMVKMLYVVPSFRGLGLGKALVNTFTEEAGKHVVRTILFEVPEKLYFMRNMLEKEEYQPATRIYTRDMFLPYQ